MSDRPAPPAQPPAPPRTPTQPRPTKAPDTVATPAAGPTPPAGPAAPTASGPGDTAVRVGLAERIQAKLAAATDKSDKSDKGGSTAAGEAATVVPAPTKKPRPRGPRRARLRLTRIDPWSVMKTAFLLSVAFGVVTIVSVLMVWSVLGAAGVWDSINKTVQDIVGGQDASSFDVQNYVGTSRVLGFTMLVAVIDVVLLTAIATLGAFLYNMAAALLGGIEVTLAEDN